MGLQERRGRHGDQLQTSTHCALRLFFPAVPLGLARQRHGDFGRASRSRTGASSRPWQLLVAAPVLSQPTFSHVDARKACSDRPSTCVHSGRRPRRGTLSRLLANLERGRRGPGDDEAGALRRRLRLRPVAFSPRCCRRPQQPVRIHLDHTVFEIMALRRDDPRLVTCLSGRQLSRRLRPAIRPSLTVVLKRPTATKSTWPGLSSAPGSPLRALSSIRCLTDAGCRRSRVDTANRQRAARRRRAVPRAAGSIVRRSR